MDISNDIAYGNRLKFLRESKNLTQADLAIKIGLSNRAIQVHEAGGGVSKNTLKRYIEFYKCDRVWLQTGLGVPFPEAEPLNHIKGLADADGLYGQTQRIKTSAGRVDLTHFQPRQGSSDIPTGESNNIINVQDRFWQAVSGLQEIYNSEDTVLIPAIESNIRAFRISARRDEIIKDQEDEIKQLQHNCEELKGSVDEMKKRLDDLDKRLTLGTPGPKDALNSS